MTNAQFPSSIAIFAWEVGDGGDKLVKGGGERGWVEAKRFKNFCSSTLIFDRGKRDGLFGGLKIIRFAWDSFYNYCFDRRNKLIYI